MRHSASGGRSASAADDPDVLVHDPSMDDPTTAFALSRLTGVTPVGVFRDIDSPSYDELMDEQLVSAKEKQGPGDLMGLLHGGDTWDVS